MQIKNLKLLNFRNYKFADADLSPGVNLILGENAQGKTNFLESIFFLSCVKSFHAKNERELILFGENEARIGADIITRERDLSLRIDLSTNAKRKIYENGILQKKLLDYVGTVQTVLFSPDDLYLIKEGPAIRRRFLNIAISQLKPNYIQTLAEYNRITEHKSKILKDESMSGRKELLEVFNEKLAISGAMIIKYRCDFINDLLYFARNIHNEMSGGRETLSIRYVTDRYINDINDSLDEIAKNLLHHLNDRKAAELESQSCLVGAHKDDMEILIDGKPAKFFASQGQIRTAVLSIKMAERDVFCKVGGELPILLLDDVLSELDENRQGYLLNKISHGQVIISSCHNHMFSKASDLATFEVKSGEILKTN